MRMAFRRPRASIGLGAPLEPEAETAGAIAGEARRCRGGAGGMPEEGSARQGISSPAAPTRWRKAGARRLAQPRAPFRPRPVRPACRAFPCPPCLKSPCSPCAPQAPSVPAVFKRQRPLLRQAALCDSGIGRWRRGMESVERIGASREEPRSGALGFLLF